MSVMEFRLALQLVEVILIDVQWAIWGDNEYLQTREAKNFAPVSFANKIVGQSNIVDFELKLKVEGQKMSTMELRPALQYVY